MQLSMTLRFVVIIYFVVINTFSYSQSQENGCKQTGREITTYEIDCTCKLSKALTFITNSNDFRTIQCTTDYKIDFTKYNLVVVFTSSSGKSTYNYALYDNGSAQKHLKVNITRKSLNRIAIPVVIAFLVLKKDCPSVPKLCLTRNN